MFRGSASRLLRVVAAGNFDVGPVFADVATSTSYFASANCNVAGSSSPVASGFDNWGSPSFGARCFSDSPADVDQEAVPGAASNLADSLLNPDSIVQLAAACDHATIVAEAAGRWPIIAGLQYGLDWMHLTTGMPWWATIAATTLVFRLLTFPVALFQIKNTYRMSQAKPESELLVTEYQNKVASGMDMQEARTWYTTELGAIWKKYDCNPMKSFGTLAVNGTLFVSFFMALRGLSEAQVPSMTWEGLSWFSNLTVADPYYALPVLSALFFLATVELGAADGMQGQSEAMVKRMRMMMRILSVVIVPFTINLPSGVFMYWIASNAFSLGQTTLLKNRKVKEVLGVPDLDVKTKVIKEMVGKPVQTFSYNPLKAKPKRKKFASVG
ncbi:hypothetical protein BSKO_05142 [Bryopsis sp. KO-2023]|nr:hypothetical protein BSKO_05142 [Bryopsis sp. KO-2023]